MQLLYKKFFRIKLKTRMSHSIRINRSQSTRIKARNTIIQSIKRKMKNSYAKKSISSRNVHTSSNSIEKENERRTKM
jgi:hypothetical protein